MSTLRQNKINELLLQELSQYFREESRTICLGAMVTPTVVRVSPDMTYAKVFISIFGGSNNQESFDNIKTNQQKIRYEMGTRLKKSLRRIPEFDFRIDDSLDYAMEIDKLLKK